MPAPVSVTDTSTDPFTGFAPTSIRGINGVRLAWEECETQYNTLRSVECYERLKGKGAVVVFPISTGVMYQLIPRTAEDKISVIQVGAGMTASADGRWVPLGVPFPDDLLEPGLGRDPLHRS